MRLIARRSWARKPNDPAADRHLDDYRAHRWGLYFQREKHHRTAADNLLSSHRSDVEGTSAITFVWYQDNVSGHDILGEY
jgi:hypothetical protein